MVQQRLLDTNFIVRVLVRDHEKHAAIAQKLFAACERGEIKLVVLPAVLAECVFVLESFYGQTRPAIAGFLGTLISAPGVEIAEQKSHLDALDRYEQSGLHFVDCVIAASAASQNVPVATFDGGFKSFKDVRVKLD